MSDRTDTASGSLTGGAPVEAPARFSSLPGIVGACDCHVHVFGPQARFPFVAERRYTPPDATLEDYRAIFRPLGIQRTVLSAPSVHGLDNDALLHALRAGGKELRGVIMVDRAPDQETLTQLHSAGVRGVRTQLKRSGDKPLSLNGLREVATVIAPWGWHVEIHADVAETPGIDRLCADFPVPVVIEHMGHMPTSHEIEEPGFQALLRLLGDGGWVKLSGAYINSIAGPPYADVAPYARALLAAAPGRAVWGSNWPHPHQALLPDDQLLAALPLDWIDDIDLLQAVLSENPARLYDYPAPSDNGVHPQ